MTTMDTLMKALRFTPLKLKKLALARVHAVRGHLRPEEIATFLSHRLSRGAQKRALNHFAACEDCRKMVAGIANSELAVQDVDAQ